MNPISLSAFLQSAALVPDQIEIFLYRIKMDHECNVKIDWEKFSISWILYNVQSSFSKFNTLIRMEPHNHLILKVHIMNFVNGLVFGMLIIAYLDVVLIGHPKLIKLLIFSLKALYTLAIKILNLGK
ncbi:hypothetical protein KEM48_009031 [Puccinia striiformis f. sp. tritici PST-130]|nr:hypothetical protein KEM48_009031 [Puccinia striiformis f. sp. tritici PST-130]